LNTRVAPWYSGNTFGLSQIQFVAPSLHSGVVPPADGFWPVLATTAGTNVATLESRVLGPLDAQIDYTNINAVVVIGRRTESDFGNAAGGNVPGGNDLYTVDVAVREHGSEVPIIGGVAPNSHRRRMSLAVLWEGPSFGTSDAETFITGTAFTVLHEVGHWMNIPDRYGYFNGPVPGYQPAEWYSPMGSPSTDFLSPHWLGRERELLGYFNINSSNLSTIGEGQAQTLFEIVPGYLPAGPGKTHAVRIPVSGSSPSAFRGYWVESRQRRPRGTSRSNLLQDRVYEQGVLIAWIDETLSGPGTRITLVPDPSGTAFPGGLAPFAPGSQYMDPARGIRISVLSAATEGWFVQVDRSIPPVGIADPGALGPPSNSADAEDLWIDSPLNGWGVFRYGNSGQPNALYGDFISPNVTNRLCYRIRNLGNAPAQNVTFDLWLAPMTAGRIAGTPGAVKLNNSAGIVPLIPANSFVEACQDFTPGGGLTAELVVTYPGDPNIGNNIVTDTFWNIDSARQSNLQYQTIQGDLRIQNGWEDAIQVSGSRQSFPARWATGLATGPWDLAKGQNTTVQIGIDPNGLAGLPPTGNELGQSRDVHFDFHARVGGSSTLMSSMRARVNLVEATTISVAVTDKTSSGATLRGCLSPALAGQRIAVMATVAGFMPMPLAGLTDSSGCFSGTVAGPAGTWEARAGFIGTDRWGRSVSPPSVFPVP
jgi:hypothetical protein